MVQGLIESIERFCINDGPGIRSRVFFMGCPLRCKWCSNPETWELKPRIFVDNELCNGCEKCIGVCGEGAIALVGEKYFIDEDRCNLCKKCLDICGPKAIKIIGKVYEVDEVAKELLKDKIFYDTSSGGVTITGGEPTMQIEFLTELCIKLKKNNIHIALDSCGYFDFKNFHPVLDYIDLILFDVKLINEDLHRKFTGVSNKKIIKNLYELDKLSFPVHLRLPIIKKVNDSQEEINGKIKLISSLKNVERVDIIPYHNLGSKKYDLMNKPSPKFEKSDTESLEIIRKEIINSGVDCHILAA